MKRSIISESFFTLIILLLFTCSTYSVNKLYVEKGEKVFNLAGCTRCHGMDGKRNVITNISLVNSTITNHPNPLFMAEVLLNGGPNIMPPFNHLSDQELAFVMYYIRLNIAEKKINDLSINPQLICRQRKIHYPEEHANTICITANQ